jgi:23S rRNA (cytidine1920-2'-O)/16S rRNA (cytidine1409-2'-O)-methyltransferase
MSGGLRCPSVSGECSEEHGRGDEDLGGNGHQADRRHFGDTHGLSFTVRGSRSAAATGIWRRVPIFSTAKVDIVSAAIALVMQSPRGTGPGPLLTNTVKTRADQMLVERGLAESRAKAQALILAGLVFSGERRVDKAGQALPAEAPLEVRGREHPWVSRGGVKLAHALDHFGWDVAGAVALDVGSSTGGFTDVLLQRGAAKIYAVDVGTNQLAWSLRQDPRVVVHEKTNARYLTPEIVPEPVDILVCDASFIALAKVLDTAVDLVRPGGRMIALVKPQFEAGREEVGKGGVVRDAAVHARVCAAAAAWIEARGWRVDGVTESPITGPEGNREFLLAATKLDPLPAPG